MKQRVPILLILLAFCAFFSFCEKPKPKSLQTTFAEDILSGKHLQNDIRLKALDEESVSYLINVIYAKNGKIFTNPTYAKEFSAAPWYKPVSQKVDQNIKGDDLSNLEKLTGIRTDLALRKFSLEKNPDYSGALTDLEKEFIGIWQRSPVMGSGWTESYAFFPSRIIIQRPNQMDCERRDYFRIGHWLIKEKTLVISWFAKAQLEGGKLEKAQGSCGGSLELVGALPKTSRLNTIEVEAATIELPKPLPDLGQLETSISQLKYYQSRKDPNDY